MTFRPQFTRRVDLGHLIQAGVLTAIGTAIGAVFLSLQPQITDLAQRTAALRQESQQHDAAIRQLQDDNRHLTDSISSTLAKLGDQLSDLRVLVAKEGRGGR